MTVRPFALHAPVITLAALAASCIGGVATTTRFGAIAVLTAAVCIGGVLVLRRFGSGVALAVLLMAVLDGLPGPSTQYLGVGRGVTAQDVLVVGSLAVFAVLNARTGWALWRESRLMRQIGCLCALAVAWWVLTWIRSVGDGVPPQHAANFGKDFLFAAVALILVPGTLVHARTRRVFVIAIAVLALPVAVAEILVSAGSWDGGPLVHPLTDTEQYQGLRLYTTVSDIIAFAGIFAIGGLFLLSRPRDRAACALVAAVCLLDVVMSLTRAKWLGVPFGLATGLAIVVFSNPALRHKVLSRVAVVTVLLIAALPIVMFATPNLGDSLSQVEKRFSGISTELRGGVADPRAANTLEYRDQLRSKMRTVLGDNWVQGLAFADPRTKPEWRLPRASIRNSDVGVMNPLMTIGLIGVVLIYAPLLLAWWACAQRLALREGEDNAVYFGVVCSLTFTIVTSYNLGILFSPAGVVTTAFVVGLGVAVAASAAESHRESAASAAS